MLHRNKNAWFTSTETRAGRSPLKSCSTSSISSSWLVGWLDHHVPSPPILNQHMFPSVTPLPPIPIPLPTIPSPSFSSSLQPPSYILLPTTSPGLLPFLLPPLAPTLTHCCPLCWHPRPPRPTPSSCNLLSASGSPVDIVLRPC